MPLNLEHHYLDSIIVDVIDDTVEGSDVARVSDIISTLQGLGVTSACARVLCQFKENSIYFLTELWIGLLPLL